MQQSHVSRGSGGPGASSSGPATSTERGRTTTAGEDYSEFWTSCSNDMLPSWGWNGEDLSGLISTNKDTPSLSSAGGVASLDDELAGATVTQTSPPDIEIHPPQGDHRRDLYRQLADLSHTLSQDAQGLASSSLGADLDLKHVGSSCIQRAFKCLEALKSLTDELRIKTQHSLQALPQADVLLTPNSDWSRTGVFFTEKDADHLGRSCQTGPGTTTTADVRPGTDRHLDMIMSLHIVTSYVCLNQILKRTLGSILAAVVSQQKGGGDGSGSSSTEKPLLLWPDIQIEGLTGDGDNLLRVRLFAETCLHVATGIHKRLESLTSAAKDTMGSSLSRPMMMVLGGGGDSLDELDVDIRGIKLLCSQISSAVEERAW
ncbi:uncharacterized protein GLRG_11513 [Colletotrichum graminicola M1.001]|uniref:Aflatoxin regulatory protein domain-containing protein n=1 Tax=Colletotrichum graminicola (strain M1.001 / M2 / FGSC 10212) TaxID=645133 RepID=E3QZT0_COLGM|nr:uncharacterized protein GLRG_11513 [Colletotrichum graminicola M1.001]EFQ36368.1 hypothetical protein GLRG_11513 [Colletotrichum graminicola M1.001]